MKKILEIWIIDENRSDADLLEKLLKTLSSWRVGTTWFKTAREGLARVREISPDVIFMAYAPGSDADGDEIRRFRRAGVDAAIVLLAGRENEIDPVEARRTRASDWLGKDNLTRASVDRLLRYLTGKEEVERRLLERESCFTALLDQSDADIVLYAADTGEIVEFNDRAHESLGYTREAFGALRVRDIEGPGSDAKVEERFRGLLDTGEGSYDTTHLHKNGERFDFHVSNRVVLIHGKLHILSMRRQIGRETLASVEKEELEERLRQARKMEAIGALAGGVAHDFNNILGIILGNVELAMLDIPTWSPVHFNFDEIRTACQRARDVVKQLLSFSRKTRHARKPVKINTVIKESLKLLRASIPTIIDIHANIPKECGAILADPTQIHQVLINLCTNAAHAMYESGGVLEVRLQEVEVREDVSPRYHDLKPDRYIKLTVSDTGCGIDPEIKDRIFDPYFTTKEMDKGTGIGLSVVHGIIEDHDGVISVESAPGKGAAFHIFFPVIDEWAEPELDIPVELLKGDERILLVDDEEAIVNLGQHMLERLGYHVDALTDPVEALELFRENSKNWDLIISDMTMPGMTGDKLLEEVLKIRPGMPIILCTGFSERISREEALEKGIRGYMEKPFNLTMFSKTVRTSLDGKPSVE
ncbi:MAG: response regulator [Desulfobacterales bacterium]|nr:response regulator [Desulfobacterales bacterium]